MPGHDSPYCRFQPVSPACLQPHTGGLPSLIRALPAGVLLRRVVRRQRTGDDLCGLGVGETQEAQHGPGELVDGLLGIEMEDLGFTER